MKLNKGDGQQLFSFMHPAPDKIPAHIDNPETDNDKLQNLQYDYYHGKKEALGFMYLALRRIALKMIIAERNKKKFFMDRLAMQDKAEDAALLVIDQYTGNELVITKSFTAYLYLQVRKVLYSQTAGEKFERWCIERRINLFSLDCRHRWRDLKLSQWMMYHHILLLKIQISNIRK